MSDPIPGSVANPARRNLAMTIAVTSLGFAVVQLDGSILNTALSQIGISLGSGIDNSVIFGISFALALYFQRALSYSAVETGLTFLPFALMLTAANVVVGRSVARFGSRASMIFGATDRGGWLRSSVRFLRAQRGPRHRRRAGGP